MSSNIPIVQGIAVTDGNSGTKYPQSYHDYNYIPTTTMNQGSYTVQDLQQLRTSPNKQFQDVFWAVLFGAHLVVMIVIMSLMSSSIQSSGFNYSGVVWCVSMCALVALGLSTMALGFMMQFATEMVKLALFFSVGCSLAVGIMGALAGQVWMSILGFASFAIGCCYAYVVWGRIPVS